MKRSFLLLTLALLLAAVPALADSPAAKAEAAPLFLEQPSAPATPAVADLEGAQEPLFVDDVVCVIPLPGYNNCSISSSCSDRVACAETGTPVKITTCTCCETCTGVNCPLPPNCESTSFPSGCC